MRALWLTLFVVTLGVATPFAIAQVSGGSFGGGGFSGGGGGGYSGGGGGYSGGGFSGGGWGGSSGYSSGYSYTSSSAGGGLFTLLIVALAFLVFIGKFAATNHSGPVHRGADGSWGRIDVVAIQLAIDARARRFVQEQLMTLARGDTSSPAGLAMLARETALLLRRAEAAWIYAAVQEWNPSAPSQAEAEFRRVANEARGRFRHELIRGHQGELAERDAPGTRARAEEGEGVVVVTFLVAAHVEIPNGHDASRPEDLHTLLQRIIALQPYQLAAFEVIWSPAEETDRMSTAELETLYPELRRLPSAGRVGRVFCGHCGGPFAHELPRCPHCGAPSESASPALT